MTKRKKESDSIENPKNPVGRPSIYTEELGRKICHALASSTKSIMKLSLEHSWFPSHQCINEWRLNNKEFGDQYANARRVQADLLVEEILDIADDVDAISDNIQKARVQIDTRKWLACKLMPKVYGERITNDTVVTFNHEKALAELK